MIIELIDLELMRDALQDACDSGDDADMINMNEALTIAQTYIDNTQRKEETYDDTATEVQDNESLSCGTSQEPTDTMDDEDIPF